MRQCALSCQPRAWQSPHTLYVLADVSTVFQSTLLKQSGYAAV